MVCAVINGKSLPAEDKLVETLLSKEKAIRSIIVNSNTKDTNVILGEKCRTLWGSDSITDILCGLKFRISPLSFYQVNPKATLRLYELAKEFADLSGKEVLWDLYCGIGTIGLFMADKAKKVVGVEVVPDAIENAKTNAHLNGIENAEFYCGKAESLAPRLVQNGERPDVVVLDPPRKGCEESLLQTVTQVKPKRIVYVSCKPSTLARDLKYLTDHGYGVKRVVPVNMFPKTSHIESVALLVKEKGCP